MVQRGHKAELVLQALTKGLGSLRVGAEDYFRQVGRVILCSHPGDRVWAYCRGSDGDERQDSVVSQRRAIEELCC